MTAQGTTVRTTANKVAFITVTDADGHSAVDVLTCTEMRKLRDALTDGLDRIAAEHTITQYVTPMSAGTRVRSANGDPGTVVGNMTPSGEIIAIRLDTGRNISCLARKCTLI